MPLTHLWVLFGYLQSKEDEHQNLLERLIAHTNEDSNSRDEAIILTGSEIKIVHTFSTNMRQWRSRNAPTIAQHLASALFIELSNQNILGFNSDNLLLDQSLKKDWFRYISKEFPKA
ncbi:Uncharacterised protein [BD1-7 clade bacterium]|uniref:Uncharacterized protein n=1 Tax=BD1-7 clade bacterium TaxID=2029982 RepID=A0A5S9N6X4_9GAMM|nr:Uncharacterised protein [BD1-7 clade bacterium]CAA0084638.1 Uncharacterised protein [BD1-7 clade bacterium]